MVTLAATGRGEVSDSKKEENQVVVTRGKELLVIYMELVGLSVDCCGRDRA